MEAFDDLSPNIIISAVENALGEGFTTYLEQYPSYINRVYEVESDLGERYIVKFYRPGRWSLDAVYDEHDFIMDLYRNEIPVVPPLTLSSGDSIGDTEGILFALFEKRSGRLIEITKDEDWVRLGALVGRMHRAGFEYSADSRINLTPLESTRGELITLLDIIPGNLKEEYREVVEKIIRISAPLFKDQNSIRIHGDCHGGNILERGEEGLLLIDFDDMAMGPAIQDLWLLLPGYSYESSREMELLIEGYESFLPFPHNQIQLIEPLRAMRMVYFTSWCSTQMNDFKFRNNFPDWGSRGFWLKEIEDLNTQLLVIKKSLNI